jgi:hypothetical protein
MKNNGQVEVQLHVFLNLKTDGIEHSALVIGHFNPENKVFGVLSVGA